MITTLPPELIERLKTARRVTVLTGAGTSAESGVPTFREAQTGLWARYDPHQLATPHAFQENPRLVWDWYEWRRGLVKRAEPNPGHTALADLETFFDQFILITQNVDGLHQRAGSKQVLELHGNILQTKCSQENIPISAWQPTNEAPPRCPNCQGLLRPDVVWFGESLPLEAIEAAWEAAENCEVFFSIGTSTVVEPAASLPYVALQNGAVVVEVNPQSTPLSHQAHFRLQGPSGEILPLLQKQLKMA